MFAVHYGLVNVRSNLDTIVLSFADSILERLYVYPGI